MSNDDYDWKNDWLTASYDVDPDAFIGWAGATGVAGWSGREPGGRFDNYDGAWDNAFFTKSIFDRRLSALPAGPLRNSFLAWKQALENLWLTQTPAGTAGGARGFERFEDTAWGYSSNPSTNLRSTAHLLGVARLITRLVNDMGRGVSPLAPPSGIDVGLELDREEDFGTPRDDRPIGLRGGRRTAAGSSKAKAGSSGSSSPSETRSSTDDGRRRDSGASTSSPTKKDGAPGGGAGSGADDSSASQIIFTNDYATSLGMAHTNAEGKQVQTVTFANGTQKDYPSGSVRIVDPDSPDAANAENRKKTDTDKKPPEKKKDDDEDEDTGGNTTRTDPDSPGASEGAPRRIQLPIVPSLADKFSRAMMELARASAGGGGTRTPWGGPTDGPSWTPFGPALAYGDPSEGGGGSGNGGGGDGWGEGPMFEGESAVPRRLPTPLERMRAGMNFGRWNTLPGDPPPVDLRTARMHTVDDDGPSGAINTSAHEMYLQRFVNPVARVATRRRG